MDKFRVFLLVALLLACSTLVGTAGSGTPSVNWSVFGSGGGLSSDGNITLNDTLGQPTVGHMSGGDVLLGSGYWQDARPRAIVDVVYLPVIRR